MKRQTGTWLVLVVALAAANWGCSAGDEEPQIEVDINIRNLCNVSVTNERDVRCDSEADCESAGSLCWQSGETYHTRGFCRDCVDTCPAGEGCDHNWCHKPCQDDGDCASLDGTHCTGGFCRKPSSGQWSFAFCNRGAKDLEVYTDQTKLYGAADACAFSNWEWSPPDQNTVRLAPGACELYLNVEFRPPTPGEYRGLLLIHSNSVKTYDSKQINPLPLMLCTKALDATCQNDEADCPSCASCTFDEFKDLIDDLPDPGCPAG